MFIAWLSGHQYHFRMVTGREGLRSLQHLSDLFVLTDELGLFPIPSSLRTACACCSRPAGSNESGARGLVRRSADWADSLPRVRPVGFLWRQSKEGAVRCAPPLVVLDDDPTGTQTVRDLPVLTRWTVDDIRWALQQGTSWLLRTHELAKPLTGRRAHTQPSARSPRHASPPPRMEAK